jgi:hypothetical protein
MPGNNNYLMNYASTVLLFVGLLFQNNANCQEAWILKKDKNGIKVFAKKNPAYRFNELKVECVFDGRISQLAAVLLDVNKQYKWAYKTAVSTLLKEENATEVYFYTVTEVPWPFENRDMVIHMSFKQNVTNKTLTVLAKNVDGFLPVKEKIVRLKYSSAVWTVTPISNKQYKIEYRVQIDPGDGLPIWLLNLFSSDGPYESFKNLKEMVKQPQYAQAKYPFIID